MTTISQNLSANSAHAGKHLTFLLGAEIYGIPVLAVREIIRMVEITVVPRMPAFIRGVINLRGKIIPVLDLRLKFGLSSAEITERTCIVVVQIKSISTQITQIGLVVDAVEDVVNITPTDIEEMPDFGPAIATDYITGLARLKGQITALIDIDCIVSSHVCSGTEFQS